MYSNPVLDNFPAPAMAVRTTTRSQTASISADLDDLPAHAAIALRQLFKLLEPYDRSAVKVIKVA
jgi:hypothetical protein